MKRLRAMLTLFACSSLLMAAATGGAFAQAPIPPPPGSEPPKPPAIAPAKPAPAPTTPAGAAETGPALTAPPITTEKEMEQVFDEFYSVGLDVEKPLAVHGLKIRRDTFELTLTQGTVYLATPIMGQVTGAYFTGTGSVKMTLPNQYDRKELQASFGKSSVDEPITELVLRFNDGTDREILAGSKPGAGAGGDPSATWDDRRKIDFNSIPLQMDTLVTWANGLKGTASFMAEVQLGNSWYDFIHQAGERIENSFFREDASGSASKRDFRVLANFHRPEDYDAKGNYDLMPESDAKDIAAVRHLEMSIDIPNTKSVLIDAHLTVEALREGVRALSFRFGNNIDAVMWSEKGRPITTTLVADASGKPLPYLHRWHELVVLLPAPLAKGAKTVVEVKATEDTINQLTSRSYWIYTGDPWFPTMGSGARYTMDWTVKIAKPLRVAGTGDLVKEWQEGDMNCAHWKTEVPVRLASFIMGDFKESEGEYKRDGGAGQVHLTLWTIHGGDEHFKGNADNILYNIGQGLKTYEGIYGRYPFEQLDIAEMAHGLNFAESPPGILLVSTVVKGGTILEDHDGNEKLVTDEQGGLGKLGGGGTGDEFVFHELAHQWWYHNVGMVSPEDAWISESFAEYSSGMMIDAIDPKRFQLLHKGWKQHAIEHDPYGTINAAYRSNTREHPDTYYYMVYYKGPCVLHMLRTWMGWDKFSQYLNTIQTKYKGTNINTDTLAREASKTMGYDMFPFFDQWIRDKGIPKVHYSWTAAADAEGKQVITIKTRQEDEANPKILMVPVALDFGKGQPTIVPKPILKAQTDIQLRVPAMPKSVVLDPDETQLAVFLPDQK